MLQLIILLFTTIQKKTKTTVLLNKQQIVTL